MGHFPGFEKRKTVTHRCTRQRRRHAPVHATGFDRLTARTDLRARRSSRFGRPCLELRHSEAGQHTLLQHHTATRLDPNASLSGLRQRGDVRLHSHKLIKREKTNGGREMLHAKIVHNFIHTLSRAGLLLPQPTLYQR